MEKTQGNKKKNQRKEKHRISEKITNESLLRQMNLSFTRDAEWFKRTNEKINQVKEELAKNFYSEEKKNQKIDFIRKLRNKLKDYKDALKFADTYKMIRFFERRKLERKLKQIHKSIEQLKDNPDEEKLKELTIRKDSIVQDINYVKFYPKSYKYYSLFPKKDQDNPVTIEKRIRMRKKIEYYVKKKAKQYESDTNINQDTGEINNTNEKVELDYEKEVRKKKSKIEDDDFFEINSE